MLDLAPHYVAQDVSSEGTAKQQLEDYIITWNQQCNVLDPKSDHFLKPWFVQFYWDFVWNIKLQLDANLVRVWALLSRHQECLHYVIRDCCVVTLHWLEDRVHVFMIQHVGKVLFCLETNFSFDVANWKVLLLGKFDSANRRQSVNAVGSVKLVQALCLEAYLYFAIDSVNDALHNSNAANWSAKVSCPRLTDQVNVDINLINIAILFVVDIHKLERSVVVLVLLWGAVEHFCQTLSRAKCWYALISVQENQDFVCVLDGRLLVYKNGIDPVVVSACKKEHWQH